MEEYERFKLESGVSLGFTHGADPSGNRGWK